MLQHLSIENYALIKGTEIDFSQGFSAITGETGAGKSIMLGAIALVLGQRADSSVLWDKEKKCVVEATFLLDNKDTFVNFFDDNQLDFDNITILRREVLNNGKSRAFINDTPVQLSLMKELGERLIDVHSQFNTLTLKSSDFQFKILDSYIENKIIFNKYFDLFSQWRNTSKQIKELEEQESQFQKDLSYYQFLSEEFEDAKLNDNEQETLEQEVELMSNAEEIKVGIAQTINLLDNEDSFGVLSQLQQSKSNLSKLTSYHHIINNLYQRLESSFIELKDIAGELINFNDTIAFDAKKLEDSNARLDLIYRLEKKHNVSSINELLIIRDEIDNKLCVCSTLSDQINILKNKSEELFEELLKLSTEITNQRNNAARKIEEDIKPLLCDMGMRDAVLKISITKSDRLLVNGVDDIDFLFNANKGGELGSISKVISGGELSRLMLALKAIMSNKTDMPTIIFDEIDTGVSGDIASKVGAIMREMSKKHQLIAITHLPQIAAKANNHFKVYKETVENSTVSQIRLLNYQQRVNELAVMISNDKITQASLANARELLS